MQFNNNIFQVEMGTQMTRFMLVSMLNKKMSPTKTLTALDFGEFSTQRLQLERSNLQRAIKNNFMRLSVNYRHHGFNPDFSTRAP